MTAICTIDTFSGRPLLVGDALISNRKSNVKVPVILPTYVDAQSIRMEIGDLVPETLEQKLIQLSENIVLAWSGSRSEAMTAVRSIQELLSPALPSYDEVVSALQSIEPCDLRESSLLLLVQDAKNTHMIGVNAEDMILDTVGRVRYAGSGGAALAVAINEIQELLPSEPYSEVGFWAKTMIMHGQLMRREITNPLSLVLGYGGAYEIATVNDGSCAKLGQFTHFFYDVIVSNENSYVCSLTNAFEQTYSGEDLSIKAYATASFAESKFVLSAFDREFIVKPFRRTHEHSVWKDAELASDGLRHHMVSVFSRSGSFIGFMSFIDSKESLSPIFRVEFSDEPTVHLDKARLDDAVSEYIHADIRGRRALYIT